MRQLKQQQQQSPAIEATAKPPLPPPPHHRTPPPLPLPPPWPHTRHHSDESPRSPLRSDSPHFSDLSEKPNSSPPSSKSAAAAEKYYSPLQSPLPNDDGETTPDGSVSHTMINLSRAGRLETLPSALVADGGGGGAFGGSRRRSNKRVVEEIVNRSSSSKEARIVKAALVIRVCEVALSLISFSVMATDRTEGWSGDSFDRYKEYRFCLSINVIAFAYAAFQACDLAYNLATGKHVFSYHFRYQFDFLMDQALAYLLMSASSASASRVDDWQTNWGKDAFTAKASVSVSLSFLAFFGFALSSLISGYNLCNRDFI